MKNIIYITLISLLTFPFISYSASVCLDPGHGGSDPGACGSYCCEDEANLLVAFKAQSYLQQAGVTVGMTRTSDKTVSLEDRVSYANSQGFDRFMSIHHNSYNGTVQGTETYCYVGGSAYSFNLRNNVHSWLLWAFNYTDRGAKTASYYVLRATTMPAILGEASFIDYQNESQLLCANVDDHAGREGYGYAAGYCDHMGIKCPPYGGSPTCGLISNLQDNKINWIGIFLLIFPSIKLFITYKKRD